MFQVYKQMANISMGKLRYLYREQLIKMQKCSYPNLDDNEGALLSEQDFFYDIRTFLGFEGAFIAIWCDNERYISALNVEKYADGLLLSGFETDPEFRNKGFGSKLIGALLDHMSAVDDVCIYSHIRKNNIASFRVHQKCGFQILYDYARFIDETVSNDSYTLMLNLKNSDRQ